ncbi:hypothetical protein J9253_12775 [Thiothrix litoralis]|uniref:Uncharacterized protein n=1 Tax=Thiothrix litoralis TaxID=2891210 RepID=A0ABX7WNA5_9GAMM|nr:hypothetical protein [Thiothrix litoralis]QTR44890.1 hypothetical protein J9253_12775 [Thiothrix litoralis]
MSVQDAFATPRSTVRDVAGGSGVLTDAIINALKKTRPWVLLLAIVGFISAALMAVIAVPILMGSTMMSGLEGAEAEQLGAMAGAGVMIGMGVMYLVFAAIYFMASLYLLRYAGSIKRAVSSLSVTDLEAALDQQASFWKLIGIMALIFIVLMLGLFVIGIGSAVFMGSSGL